MTIREIAQKYLNKKKAQGFKPYRSWTFCYQGIFYVFKIDNNGDIDYPNRMWH